MDFLPVFLSLKQQPALVIGGGQVAARRIGLLLQAQARVTVVAPALEAGLEQLRDSGQIQHLEQVYQPDVIDDCRLVIAATDDDQVNRQVAADARALNIPVNVVDEPGLCSFIMPSIVDRSPVVIAISTGGSSPVLSRMLRSRIEAHIPAAFGRLAALANHSLV